MNVDLLGSELSPSEQRLLAVYEELKALCDEDLPPNAHAGVRGIAGPDAQRRDGVWRSSTST